MDWFVVEGILIIIFLSASLIAYLVWWVEKQTQQAKQRLIDSFPKGYFDESN